MAFSGEIGHLTGIESPWGNAGGVVKTVEDVELMAHTGVGWIEAGSYTLEPRVGNNPNGERVYWHDSNLGETYNSLGMPNKGMDIVETEIPEMVRIAHSLNKKLVVNIAPVSDAPESESVDLVKRSYTAGADCVILNAGCPNVITDDGGRHELLSRDTKALRNVLAAINNAMLENPIAIRISPQESVVASRQICEVIRKSGIVSAVFTPNTWPGFKPTDKSGEPILEVDGNVGGKSGPAIAVLADFETKWALMALWDYKVDVVSSSGIMSAQELSRRLKLGAVAGAGTTFFYEQRNGWKEDVDSLLYDTSA